MQFTITLGMFGVLWWVLYLLFHPTLELDDTHRDLLNIILGTFIGTFGKTIDFWFRHSKKKERLGEKNVEKDYRIIVYNVLSHRSRGNSRLFKYSTQYLVLV